MRSRFGVCCLGIAAILALSACRAEFQSIESISIDFPHGETRLNVRGNGEALLSYGALPEWLVVKPGVFEVGKLAGELQSRQKDAVASEERPYGQPFGMVSYHNFDGSNKDYFLYDGEFAEALFVTACGNLAHGAGESPVLFDMVCAERIGGTGGSA
jgi:hypothetical protein